MISTFVFYMFSALALMGGCGVVISRSPVQAVLFLIFTFINCAGLFVLLNAEFLAMILAIVYVGAVAVLFLFVVMMLDVTTNKIKESFKGYRLISILIGGVILAEFVFIGCVAKLSPDANNFATNLASDHATNAHALASVLYTTYFYPFQISGFILLVAMVGAIVLTLRQRTGVETQTIATQVDRNSLDTVTLHKIKKGHGVTW